MKVVLINHSDSLGGASTVTFNLMRALREADVDATMLVTHKGTDSPHVVQAVPRWRSRLPFLAEHARIFATNGFNRKTLFKISIATDGLPLSRHPLVEEADVVVLNWVNQGMLSMDEIGLIASRKPTVWIMHDAWNLSGICHHPGSCEGYKATCGHCPLLGLHSREGDLSERTFARKRYLYSSVPIRFIAVSSWLGERARESTLLKPQQVDVIQNCFPVAEWIMPNHYGRGAVGLPWRQGKIIVICAARLDDPIKRLPEAIEALNTLADTDAQVVFVGDIRNPAILDDLKLPHFTLGPVFERRRLQAIYRSSDVVMSASSYESFGATLLEGQAAGATPVGYVHDGRSDIITDGVTGYAAGPGIRSMGEALRLALDKPIPQQKLYDAAMRYSYSNIANRYIELFKRMSNNGC